MTTTHYDLIVVGLGAMGSAVVHHATQLGLRVLGLDQFEPPHDLGSTKAETRITRLAVGEGPQYLPFVRRSHELWRELEARTGVDLLHECGGFIISEQEPVAGQRWEDFVVETARIAAGAGIRYDVMSPPEVRTRYPWIAVPNDRRVGYEPTAGLVMAERCVSVQLDLARSGGATLHVNERVGSVTPRKGAVEVSTDQGNYRSDQVVLSTGPWVGHLAAPPLAEQITVTRQVVYWFEVEDPVAFSTSMIPFVMWIADKDEDYVGLFPIPPGGTPAVKILGEQFLETTTADTVNREVTQDEIDQFHLVHVAPKFPGISSTCVRTAVCLYSNTPDDHFLVDHDPRSERITVMSPCSGHGFKHSAALGEAVAEKIATGQSHLDLEPFRSRW